MAEEDMKFWLVRRAIGAVLGGFDAPDDPFASWFGKVRVALPDEIWPTSGGKPMMPLCQFNLAELPYRPNNLADLAFITVFISQGDLPRDGAPNGDQWLLRAYPTLEGLTEIDEPAERGYILPLPIRWELIASDYPTWADVTSMAVPHEIADDYSDLFETQQGTKIGGWPFSVQHEVDWEHPADLEYVFQIDSEEKAGWSWGDEGCGYFGRGMGKDRDQWALSWQCY